jgi:predicted phage tail protein
VIKTTFRGSLGKRHGKTHTLGGATPFLVMRGLVHRLGPAFEQEIRDGKWHVCLGPMVKGVDNSIKEHQVNEPLGDVTEITVIPAVKGKGSGKWLTAIVGVVLIVVGAVLTYFGFGNVGIPMMKMGLMMAITGTISALSAKATIPNTGGSSNPSYFLNGGVNTSQQGLPVPLIFGRCQRAGSLLISQGVTSGAVA